jgi:hypothetical protein
LHDAKSLQKIPFSVSLAEIPSGTGPSKAVYGGGVPGQNVMRLKFVRLKFHGTKIG